MLRHNAIQEKILPYQQFLANHLVTAVIILNEKLTIVYANPAAEALLNRSIHRLHNKNLKLFLPIPP